MSEVDLIVDMIEGDLFVVKSCKYKKGVDLDTTEIGGMIEDPLDTIETEEMIGDHLDTIETGEMIEAHLDTIETGEMIEDPPPDMTEIGVMTEDTIEIEGMIEDMTETGEMMVNLVKTKKAAVVMKIALLTVDVTVETVVWIRMG